MSARCSRLRVRRCQSPPGTSAPAVSRPNVRADVRFRSGVDRVGPQSFRQVVARVQGGAGRLARSRDAEQDVVARADPLLQDGVAEGQQVAGRGRVAALLQVVDQATAEVVIEPAFHFIEGALHRELRRLMRNDVVDVGQWSAVATEDELGVRGGMGHDGRRDLDGVGVHGRPAMLPLGGLGNAEAAVLAERVQLDVVKADFRPWRDASRITARPASPSVNDASCGSTWAEISFWAVSVRYEMYSPLTTMPRRIEPARISASTM